MVKNYPLVFFALFTLAIGWGFFALYTLLSPTLPGFAPWMLVMGLNIPTLTAMMMWIHIKGAQFMPAMPIHLSVFALGVVTGVVGLPLVFDSGVSVGTIIGALLVSDSVAFIISTAVTKRGSGPQMRTLYEWRHHPLLWVSALLIFPVLLAMAYMVGESALVLRPSAFGNYIAALVFIAVFMGPLGLEWGLRHFAFKRLLAWMNPLFASMVLALFLWAMLMPLRDAEVPYLTLLSPFELLIALMAVNTVLGFFYLMSKGSVLLTMVAHTSLLYGIWIVTPSLETMRTLVALCLGVGAMMVVFLPFMRDKIKAQKRMEKEGMHHY